MSQKCIPNFSVINNNIWDAIFVATKEKMPKQRRKTFTSNALSWHMHVCKTILGLQSISWDVADNVNHPRRLDPTMELITYSFVLYLQHAPLDVKCKPSVLLFECRKYNKIKKMPKTVSIFAVLVTSRIASRFQH